MAQSLDRFAPARASGSTGNACNLAGPYRSSRNAQVIVFVPAGTKFPADTDGVSTTWTLVGDTTVSITPISL
jgi:hypothetical protein